MGQRSAAVTAATAARGRATAVGAELAGRAVQGAGAALIAPSALTMLMMLAFSFLKRFQGRMVHSVSRRAIDRAGYHSCIFGFLWAVPALYFFPFANHPEQLAICIVTASMMAGAAFILSNVPPAAGAKSSSVVRA